MPLWRLSSMRRDSERISFSIELIARRGIASVRAARISPSSWRNAAIDCSISGRCSDSIWLVILNRCRSSAEKSGAGGGGGGAIAGAIGGAMRCGIERGGASSSFWRAAISATAKSSEAGLSGGELR